MILYIAQIHFTLAHISRKRERERDHYHDCILFLCNNSTLINCEREKYIQLRGNIRYIINANEL